MFELEHYRVELETLSPLLGATPKDKELYAAYVAAKADPPLDRDALNGELGDVQEQEHAAGWTGFLTTQDGQPYLGSHVVLGFMKSACGALRRSPGTKSKGIKAYKKIIDTAVMVAPHKLLLETPTGTDANDLPTTARSLRANTPQGDRVALAMSDTVPTGTKITFYLSVMKGTIPAETLLEWFDYGKMTGIGQWRGSGKKGRFAAIVTPLDNLPDGIDPFVAVDD